MKDDADRRKGRFGADGGLVFYASDRKEWREWLQAHFETEKEVWFVFPVKDSGEASVPYNDAVEEALCFGWIDGVAGTLDERHSIRRFTPRRPGSRYSRLNVERLIWLDSEGLIHPKVRPLVEGVISEEYVFPEDILDAIRADEAAWKKAASLDGFTMLGNPVVKPPKTRVRLLHDGKFLYVAAEFEEPRPDGFTADKQSKPWCNDGLECYIRGAGQGEKYVQFILSVAGNHYAHWYAGAGPGKANGDLPQPANQIRIQGKQMALEVALPLETLGKSPIRFNFGRNRVVGGDHQHYSFVPAPRYLTFDGAEITLE